MFKQEQVKLPGHTYEKVVVRELSILGSEKVFDKTKELTNDISIMKVYLAEMLHTPDGKKVVKKGYTIDQFMDECPQSYIEVLASAFEKVTSGTDDGELEIAKNS